MTLKDFDMVVFNGKRSLQYLRLIASTDHVFKFFLKKNERRNSQNLQIVYNRFLSNFLIVSSQNSFVLNISESKVHTDIHMIRYL